MTDTELLHEVEQAMLGAMITRPRRAGGLPGPVVPELFTDGRHQAIAAALTGTAGEERGLLGRLRGWLARFGKRAREDRAYLETLPGLCPDAAHMDGYYGILSQARDQREARARAAMDQAAGAARVLEGAADQLAVRTAGTGRAAAPGELTASVARQARALASHARQLSQAAATAPAQPGGWFRQAGPGRPSQPAARGALAPQAASGRTAPGQSGQTAGGQVPPAPPAQQYRQATAPGRQFADAVPGPQPAAAGTAAGTPSGAQASPQASGMQPDAGRISEHDAQDLLLATLMRRPGLAREITASVPPDRFEDGPRRELYELITEFTGERRPPDPLLLAWAADQRAPAGPGGARDSWISPDYIRHIASLPPAQVNPAELVRLLPGGGTGTPAPGQPAARETDASPQPTADQDPGPRQDEDRTAEPALQPEPGPARADSSPEASQKPEPGPARGNQAPARQPGASKPAAAAGQPAHAEPAPASGPALVEPPPPDPSQAGVTPRM